LISQEESLGARAAAEATASLCLPQAAGLCARRAQLQPLAAHPQLRALVLSTDGVRKSCASDADFLALCSQVIDLNDPQQLEHGLEQITRQGSGDDVSLAIGRRAQPAAGRWPRRAGLALSLGSGTVALATALVAGSRLLQRPAPRPDPVLQQQQALCADPSRIRANLTPRRAQLLQLQRDPTLGQRLLAAPERDPLGALLARSQRSPLRACPPLEQHLATLWRDAGGKMPAAPPRPDERPPAGSRPAAPGSR
jgi:hypothetical protein